MNEQEFIRILRKYARRGDWCSRPVTLAQLQALGMYFAETYGIDRPMRLAVISHYIGRTIISTWELTRGEANALLQVSNSNAFADPFRLLTLTLIQHITQEGIPDAILNSRKQPLRRTHRRPTRRGQPTGTPDFGGNPVPMGQGEWLDTDGE